MREARGLSTAEVARAIRLEEPWVSDLEAYDSELEYNVSLEKLWRLATLLDVTPAKVLGVESLEPVGETVLFAALLDRIKTHVAATGIDAEAFGDATGWDVALTLAEPVRTWDWCVQKLHDVCAALGVWWVGALPLEPAPSHIVLFRPVGQAEFDLIAASDYRAFPPRLPHQPIFYPVLYGAYAIQIAREWNTKDAASGYVGYVTKFRVSADVVARYPVQVVGARQHEELWVPAEELGEFNAAILGTIDVIGEYRGPSAATPRA